MNATAWDETSPDGKQAGFIVFGHSSKYCCTKSYTHYFVNERNLSPLRGVPALIDVLTKSEKRCTQLSALETVAGVQAIRLISGADSLITRVCSSLNTCTVLKNIT